MVDGHLNKKTTGPLLVYAKKAGLIKLTKEGKAEIISVIQI